VVGGGSRGQRSNLGTCNTAPRLAGTRTRRSRRRRWPWKVGVAWAALAGSILLGPPAAAGPPPVGDGRGGVATELVTDVLDLPIYVTTAPGVENTQYVVEKNGFVEAVVDGNVQPQPFLDISDRVATAGGQGFLSIAFDPEYATTGLFYADYVDADGDIMISEFEATSDLDADEASERRVLRIPHPPTTVHHGGTILFGPHDRLYISVGDGGGSGDPHENGQDPGKLLGKILRIDPTGEEPGDYTVPQRNPFVGRAGRDEILALGLRNPFRFSIDPPTGNTFIGDVGQAKWEEIDLESQRSLRGANFGWDHFEGTHPFDWNSDNEAPRPRRHYEPPVHEYSHRIGNAVIGGLVVRDTDLESLYGRYLFCDYNRGQIHSFIPKHGKAKGLKKLGLQIESPTSFVADSEGTVFVTSLETGKLFKLVPAP
jgi:glucose/arabinose dehydrogenase